MAIWNDEGKKLENHEVKMLVIYIEMTWVTEGYGINDLTKSFSIEDELTIWQKCGLVSTRI